MTTPAPTSLRLTPECLEKLDLWVHYLSAWEGRPFSRARVIERLLDRVGTPKLPRPEEVLEALDLDRPTLSVVERAPTHHPSACLHLGGHVDRDGVRVCRRCGLPD